VRSRSPCAQTLLPTRTARQLPGRRNRRSSNHRRRRSPWLAHAATVSEESQVVAAKRPNRPRQTEVLESLGDSGLFVAPAGTQTLCLCVVRVLAWLWCNP